MRLVDINTAFDDVEGVHRYREDPPAMGARNVLAPLRRSEIDDGAFMADDRSRTLELGHLGKPDGAQAEPDTETTR